MHPKFRAMFFKVILVLMFVGVVGFVLEMFEAVTYAKLFMALVFVITTSLVAILEISSEGDS